MADRSALAARISHLGDPRFRKSLACLLGLAVGDALGAANECEQPGQFRPIQDLTGGGPFRLDPGEWTDDTSMALCLAESIIETRGFDLRDQMARYLRWYRKGHLSSRDTCFDIGLTTRRALERFKATQNPYVGDARQPQGAGNGSLMRLAPIPIAWQHRPELAIALAGHQSLGTHPDVRCVDACRYYCALILAALDDYPRDQILDGTRMPYRHLFTGDNAPCEEIAALAGGSYRDKELSQLRPTGYVVDSMEAALWIFSRAPSFRIGALMAANLGGDSDTIAAIYGMLAGAWHGFDPQYGMEMPQRHDGIPYEWVNELARPELLLDYALRLYSTGSDPALSRMPAPGKLAVAVEDQVAGRFPLSGRLQSLSQGYRHEYLLQLEHEVPGLESFTLTDAASLGLPGRRQVAGSVLADLGGGQLVLQLMESFPQEPEVVSVSDLTGCIVTIVSRDGRPLDQLASYGKQPLPPKERGRLPEGITQVTGYFWQVLLDLRGGPKSLHFQLVELDPRRGCFAERALEFSFRAEDVDVRYRAERGN